MITCFQILHRLLYLFVFQMSRIKSLENEYLVKVVIEKGLRNKMVISGEKEVVNHVEKKILEIFLSMRSVDSKTLDCQVRL